jgi:DNA/RNA endonuclease YhcR with UshA esterase domain
MKMRNLLRLLFILTATGAIADTPPEYTAAEAPKHIGENAKVTGTVRRVNQAQGGSIFLDLGAKYPNNQFTVFIPRSAADKFPNFRKYDGFTITVSGEIEVYNNKAEIVVTDPSQIKKRLSAKNWGHSLDESVPGL